jgi:glycosyltransferase involved in cell wall biosynthesis
LKEVVPTAPEDQEKTPKPTFLVVATEWSSGKGGLSTFNRELCEGLARAGCHVTCCVERADQDEIVAADMKDVELVPADSAYRSLGVTALALSVPNGRKFDFVVGHGRLTGPCARALKHFHLPDAYHVHFIHTDAQSIEWHKGHDDASRRAEDRKAEETELVLSSDFAFGVGPLLRDEYATAVHINKKQVHEFRPGLFDCMRAEAPPPVPQCLVLGRAEDLVLKGLDIAAGALAKINISGSACKLVVRGAPQHTGVKLREQLKSVGPPSSLDIVIWEYSADRSKILANIHEASLLLMPSRAEGFGLVGLEAISAALPVLLSARSGLARLVSNLLPSDPDASAAVVVVTEHAETDVAAWEGAIADSLADRDEAFRRASRLREKLAGYLSWDLAIQDFLDIVLRGPASGPALPERGGSPPTSGPRADPGLAASATLRTVVVGPDGSGAANAEHLDAQFQSIRDDLRNARAHSALQRINQLITEHGSTMTGPQRQRVYTAKATAHLVSDDSVNALKALENAQAVDPATADGLAAGGLLALLQGDQATAFALAQEALTIDRRLERALVVLVQAAPEDKSLRELQKRVSLDGELTSGVAAALANVAVRRGLLDEAVDFARSGDRASEWPNAERKVGLASLLLQRAMESGKPDSDVGEVVGVLAEAVELLEQGDQRKDLGIALSLLGFAQELAGQTTAAESNTVRALTMAPKDPSVLFRAASVFVQREKYSQALEALEGLENPTPESRLLKAEVLSSLQRTDDALSLAAGVELQALSIPMRQEWARIQLGILAKRHQWSAARAVASRVLGLEPSNVFLLTAAARIERQSSGDGAEFIDRAMTNLTDALPQDLEYLLDELVKRRLWAQAASVLRRLGRGEENATPLETQALITYRSGDLNESLALCRQSRERDGVQRGLLIVETAVLEEVGALSDTAALLDTGLALWPSDSELLLRRALVAFRQRDKAKAVECVSDLPTFFEDANSNERYVSLLLSIGRHAHAVRAAYEQRRSAFSTSAAHSFYAQTFLRIPVELFDVSLEASVDTAIRVRSEGQGEAWWIIEGAPNPELARRELDESSALRRAMVGREVGDKVDVGALGNVELCEVVSKYVYAFRESMSLFGSILDDAAVRPVRVDGPKGLEPVLEAIRTHGERTSSIVDLYDSGRVPLGACAKLLYVSQIELALSMLSDALRTVRCSDGSRVSVEVAMATLRGRPRLVCDPLSLVVLNMLGHGSVVTAVYDKLLIPQSIVDMIHDGVVGERLYGGRRQMSVHYSDGNYYRRENTPEESKAREDFWTSMEAFVAAHCEVLPCWGALSIPRGTREERAQILDAASFDAVLLASEGGRVLLSDDLLLRMVAANEYGVSGAWTQAVLATAQETGSLTERGYAEATVKMVLAGLSFVAINGLVLVVAAEQDEWMPGDRFRKVAGLLSAATVEFTSAVAAAADFVGRLLRASPGEIKRNALLTVLLNALAAGRRGRLVAREVERVLRARQVVSPPALEDVLGVVRLWHATRLQ